MKNPTISFIILVFMLIGFYACDTNRVFEEFREVPESTWHKDSLVVFHFMAEDTLQDHNFIISIRNKTTYKYSNLWLFIEIIPPHGEVQKDTFEVSLAAPSGKWLGDGFGSLKTQQAVYRRNVRFPASGEYTVKIQQGMRDDVLKGIHDVGFRVEK